MTPTKPQIKEILMNLIYTADAKPRFIGGDLTAKLERIDDAVDDIFNAFTPDKYEKAGELLSFEDEYDLVAQVTAIEAQAKIDDSMLIDNIEGVYVWEPLEYSLTCATFLDQVTPPKND